MPSMFPFRAFANPAALTYALPSLPFTLCASDAMGDVGAAK